VDNRQFLRAEASRPESDAELDDWKHEVRVHETDHPLPGWPGARLRLTSTPQKEQDVVALFNQLLASGAFSGYDVMATSSHRRYDSLAWARLSQDEIGRVVYDAKTCPWGVERFRAEQLAARHSRQITIEFKYDLVRLLTDIRGGTKHFRDIQLAVAWVADPSIHDAADFELQALEVPKEIAVRRYPGVTHQLLSTDNAEHMIQVILLSELMDQVRPR